MISLMIIDDEWYAVKGLSEGIDWSGDNIEIAEAYSAKEAIRQMEHKSIDVVLCDIEMPEDDGLFFAEWLINAYPVTQLIFLTGHANFTYAQKALKIHAFDYILKPVDHAILKETVFRAAAQAKARAMLENDAPADARARLDNDAPAEAFNIDNEINGMSRNLLVQKALQYIGSHLESDLTRDRIAEHVHIHPVYLSKLVSIETGLTLSENITIQRIAAAKELLKTPGIKINWVARQVGFDNFSYFCRVFRKIAGMTPQEYQKSFV